MGRWGYDITAGKRERERNKEQNSPVASMRKPVWRNLKTGKSVLANSCQRSFA